MSDNEIGVASVVRDARLSILAEACERVSACEDMQKVAKQRGLAIAGLSAQVLGFWLEAVQTDLDLRCALAMERNLDWLLGFREGHALPFEDNSVRLCFVELSRSIEARLDSQQQRDEYGGYKASVEKLIDERFTR